MRIASTLVIAAALFAGSVSLARAQPSDLPIPAAKSDKLPAGIAINRKLPVPVYVDARGLTLYGMDMRTVLRWAPDAALFCRAECLDQWEPLAAPQATAANIAFPGAPGYDATRFVDNRTAPDWTVIDGPLGRQWVYKGWHMVFTRKGDARGSAAFDGADGMIWNTLKYLPPPPEFIAPPGITAVFADGAYRLADKSGQPLFTGTCAAACAGWTPLTAALASQGIGTWQVEVSGDAPQWTIAGARVFVGVSGQPLPPGATALRP